MCVIDGVFCEDPEGSVEFYEATHLTASDWGELQDTVRHRVLRTTLRAVPSNATVCSNDSCVIVPVLPSPSNGLRLPGTARLEASTSSIVSPIPHRMAPPLSRSLLWSSSSGSPYSFTRHASTVTAITGCWLPMQSSGIRSSRSGVSWVG